jgi:hypothetical protein
LVDLSARSVETIMDLENVLKNIDAFMARLDNLEAEVAAKNAELEKVTANRDAILKEKRQLEGRDFDPDAFQKKLEAQFNRNSAEVTLSRSDARIGSKYREAKAAAEAKGVPLRIVDDVAPQQQRRSSPVKYLKDADAGVLYVNADMIRRYGQARCREIATEQGASTMRAFRRAEDLPDSVMQAHAQAIADRTPGTLIEGGA